MNMIVKPLVAVAVGGGVVLTLIAIGINRASAQAMPDSSPAPQPKPRPSSSARRPAQKRKGNGKPARAEPKTHAAEVVAPSEIPSHAVEVTPAPKPAPSSPAPQPSKPSSTKPAGRTPTQAAKDLYAYVTERIRSGHARQLGDKSDPNELVQKAQRDMRGGLVADGIYGPKTMARGKELLGKPFPPRTLQLPPPAPGPVATPPKPAPAPVTVARTSAPKPATTAPVLTSSVATAQPAPAPAPKPAPAPPPPPPPPSQPVSRSPQDAARDLLAYARQVKERGTGVAEAFGYKDHPNAFVRDAQEDMGGITADGIYGPGTRTRGQQLIGTTFPAR